MDETCTHTDTSIEKRQKKSFRAIREWELASSPEATCMAANARHQSINTGTNHIYVDKKIHTWLVLLETRASQHCSCQKSTAQV